VGKETTQKIESKQSTDPDQTVRASYALLFQDGTDARSGEGLFMNRYEFGQAL